MPKTRGLGDLRVAGDLGAEQDAIHVRGPARRAGNFRPRDTFHPRSLW